MMGIGVIGYGYWGPNLVRNFNGLPDVEVIAVSDLRTERLTQVQNNYPSVETTTDYQALTFCPCSFHRDSTSWPGFLSARPYWAHPESLPGYPEL